MAQINLGRKEVSCKIVYYGPGLSGKTTNLEKVYEKTPEDNKGRMTSIATEGDRTLFFDYMPLDIGTISGMHTKFQLYTVPGQTYYKSTRKLVLQGADGVIFVADSGTDKIEENAQSLADLRDNLAENGLTLEEMPFVIQYNKRDLPDVLDIAILEEKLNEGKVPHFTASAVTGEGVIPTLKGLSRIVLDNLNKTSSQRPARPKPAGAQAAPAQPAKPAPAAQRQAVQPAKTPASQRPAHLAAPAKPALAAKRNVGTPARPAAPPKGVKKPVRPAAGRPPGATARPARSARPVAVPEKKNMTWIYVSAGAAAAALVAALLL